MGRAAAASPRSMAMPAAVSRTYPCTHWYRSGTRAHRFVASPSHCAADPASPRRTPTRLERRIIKLRVTRRWGPHRIGYHLGVPRSTVGRVLTRYRMPLLAHLDQATGLPVRRPKPHRYEASAPGELVQQTGLFQHLVELQSGTAANLSEVRA